MANFYRCPVCGDSSPQAQTVYHQCRNYLPLTPIFYRDPAPFAARPIVPSECHTFVLTWPTYPRAMIGADIGVSDPVLDGA